MRLPPSVKINDHMLNTSNGLLRRTRRRKFSRNVCLKFCSLVFINFVREQDRPTDTKRPRNGRRIFHSHRRGSARHLFRGTNQYWQHRHRVVELYFAVRSTSRGLYLMNSAAKSIAEEAENLQAFGSKARVSYHTFDRGIFRYGLAVLSVALALGIKLLLQQLHFGYPLSTSFLAAIAVSFWYAGTGPGILALVLSCAAFGFFVLPYQVDYRIVLADGSTKPVYASRSGLSHLFYFLYFALVALVMSWFSLSRRRAERLLSQARDKLEIKVAERTARLRKLNDELLGQIAERAMAEDYFRQTERRLRDLIANTPVILFALDRSGMLTLSEGKALDTFGVKPGELVGQSIFDLYHDLPDLHSNTRRALAGESVTFVTEAKSQFFEIHLIPV